MHFRLVELVSLDTTHEELKLVYVTQLFWYDPKLVWYQPSFIGKNPQTFENVTNSQHDLEDQNIILNFHAAKQTWEKYGNDSDINFLLDQLFYKKSYEDIRHKSVYDFYQNHLSLDIKNRLDEFKTVQFITLKPNSIWTPDLVVYNSNSGKHW